MVKIKGTRDDIDVTIDGRVVRIDGELIIGGFVAYKDSITEWLKPKGVNITEEEKEDIIKQVTEKTKDSEFMKIVFD